MRSQQGLRVLLTVAAALALLATRSLADTVAVEDFDGGDVNLISSTYTNLDGGGGDWFGVGAIATWPQGFPPGGTGVPFGLVDDTVTDVSTQGANPNFPPDTEAVYGQNSDFDNAFFGISDTREWTDNQLVGSWTFDISGYKDLELCIDMGGISDANSFGGFGTGTIIEFTYQVDAGPVGAAFSVVPNSSFGAYTYRPMDGGAVTPIAGGNGPLEATGDNPVTKLLAETGLAASNTFLNKTPASGAGAGEMDTFATALDGSGSQLTLTMRARVDFEAAVFDSIVVKGTLVPEPGSMLLLSLGSIVLLAGRRRFSNHQ